MIQPTNMQMPMQQPYPQQGGANAVSINIYNPQAYGSAPNATNAQNAPYAYNSAYQMPYVPTYPQMNASVPMAQPTTYQQYIPTQTPIVMPPAVDMSQTFVAPAPSAMPESVLAPQAEINQAPVVQAQPEVAKAPVEAAPVEIAQAEPTAPVVDVDSLVQNLRSADANVKGETINQIATYAQETPEIALQIVSEPIMQSLVQIINEDTTALEGPTEAQIAVAEKIAKGEQLTPEEDALSEQLSPRDMANKNRIFALYTLAMIQKLQRDELNQYIETQKANGQQTIAPLQINDLIGYNDVVNVIKNDVRPEVKVAAIQALQHIVEPQDKASVETALAEALNSQDEAVKNAATEAMAKFAA